VIRTVEPLLADGVLVPTEDGHLALASSVPASFLPLAPKVTTVLARGNVRRHDIVRHEDVGAAADDVGLKHGRRVPEAQLSRAGKANRTPRESPASFQAPSYSYLHSLLIESVYTV
jgi:hypothetical protein